MSGDQLKSTKSEILALDEQLAEADTRRKKLEAEAAARRAKNRTESLEANLLAYTLAYDTLNLNAFSTAGSDLNTVFKHIIYERVAFAWL